MDAFATVDDVIKLWRELTPEEKERTEALLPVISDIIRNEAKMVGIDFDQKVANDPTLADVARSVAVDIVGRVLNTSTSGEPMSQVTESALGYSVSGTYLSPGGGIYIKDWEKKRLGIVKKQKYGVIDFYGN